MREVLGETAPTATTTAAASRMTYARLAREVATPGHRRGLRHHLDVSRGPRLEPRSTSRATARSTFVSRCPSSKRRDPTGLYARARAAATSRTWSGSTGPSKSRAPGPGDRQLRRPESGRDGRAHSRRWRRGDHDQGAKCWNGWRRALTRGTRPAARAFQRGASGAPIARAVLSTPGGRPFAAAAADRAIERGRRGRRRLVAGRTLSVGRGVFGVRRSSADAIERVIASYGDEPRRPSRAGAAGPCRASSPAASPSRAIPRPARRIVVVNYREGDDTAAVTGGRADDLKTFYCWKGHRSLQTGLLADVLALAAELERASWDSTRSTSSSASTGAGLPGAVPGASARDEGAAGGRRRRARTRAEPRSPPRSRPRSSRSRTCTATAPCSASCPTGIPPRSSASGRGRWRSRSIASSSPIRSGRISGTTTATRTCAASRC